MRRVVIWCALTCVSSLTGCMNGWIYKDYKEPVVVNMRATPRGTRMVELDSVHLEVPQTSGLVNAEVWSRAIGDAAKQKGLKEVYFADRHVFSLFGSLYMRDRIEVWGD